MSSLPLLTMMMVVPLLGAIIVAALPGDSARLAKPIALGASLVTLVLALMAWARFDTGASETPITPVIIGEAADAKAFSAKLFERGVFATAIVFPTGPRGTARIRAMVSAAHAEDDLRFGVGQFAAVGREMGIIS